MLYEMLFNVFKFIKIYHLPTYTAQLTITVIHSLSFFVKPRSERTDRENCERTETASE